MIKRIRDFFIKLVSIKVILWFGSTTYLLVIDKIKPLVWLIVSGMVFATRTTEKIIMRYIDKKNGSS